jgi:hypothetical protein
MHHLPVILKRVLLRLLSWQQASSTADVSPEITGTVVISSYHNTVDRSTNSSTMLSASPKTAAIVEGYFACFFAKALLKLISARLQMISTIGN